MKSNTLDIKILDLIWDKGMQRIQIGSEDGKMKSKDKKISKSINRKQKI